MDPKNNTWVIHPIKKVNQTEPANMKQYYIRFNTNHGDRTDLMWRVFEEGVEHLVRSFIITVPVTDATTVEFGETKWNVSCEGNMKIIENIAYIS
jgi:hypothetical protein